MTTAVAAKFASRFWSRVKRGDGCWEWMGCRIKRGSYGLARLHGKQTLAHRVAWELAHGVGEPCTCSASTIRPIFLPRSPGVAVKRVSLAKPEVSP